MSKGRFHDDLLLLAVESRKGHSAGCCERLAHTYCDRQLLRICFCRSQPGRHACMLSNPLTSFLGVKAVAHVRSKETTSFYGVEGRALVCVRELVTKEQWGGAEM